LSLVFVLFGGIVSQPPPVVMANDQVNYDAQTPSSTYSTRIVFSDIDGTLIHYPDHPPSALLPTSALEIKEDEGRVNQNNNNNNSLLALPPSSTGMRAVISTQTLRLCQQIRRCQRPTTTTTTTGTKLVLVSGMRTTTLLNRLPYLPRADAYCSEAGGRIFYPVPIPQTVITTETKATDSETAPTTRRNLATTTTRMIITPQPYQGATEEDLQPFTIVEDMEWRRYMEEVTGVDGFVGQNVDELLPKQTRTETGESKILPASTRRGVLWEFAHSLEQRGLILDTKGYATSFRVSAKQQNTSSLTTMDTFRALQVGDIPLPSRITMRTNLGSMDFYPSISGKKNWYVKEKSW
jgi:hypothetical protein